MSRWFRRLILTANVLIALAFGAGLLYVWVASTGGPSRVTTLDRAGIIDEAKLAETYPGLASNLRYNLGMWIPEKERKAAYIGMRAGLAAAVLNVLLLGLAPWRAGAEKAEARGK